VFCSSLQREVGNELQTAPTPLNNLVHLLTLDNQYAIAKIRHTSLTQYCHLLHSFYSNVNFSENTLYNGLLFFIPESHSHFEFMQNAGHVKFNLDYSPL
jgi:hypothetical protein